MFEKIKDEILSRVYLIILAISFMLVGLVSPDMAFRAMKEAMGAYKK